MVEHDSTQTSCQHTSRCPTVCTVAREGQSLDFAALLPGVGVFGGVRRFLEIGNELIRRGHRYTIYNPDGVRPEWMAFDGEVKPTAKLTNVRHQILITNDTTYLEDFEEAEADLKLFYFALENIRGERAIATHPGWTIVANSTGMYERLRRKYKIPVEKAIGGINLDVFTPRGGATRDGYRVLAFGRVSRRKKGVPVVIRAVERFARKQHHVQLVLFDHVGPGNEADPRDTVRIDMPHEWHLNLSQHDLAALYASCDVFASAERRAGWANTVAEAMACALPVVCTHSGTRDIAIHEETAWVARWRHPWWLGRGLRAVQNDPSLAMRLRESALERIRNYSWPRVVDALEDIVARKLPLSP